MRIVLGLWLLQAVSALSAWLAFSSESRGEIVLWIGLVMGVGLLAALWFWTALRDQRRLGEAQRSERMANTTANLHASLARQRAEDAARLRSLTEKVSKVSETRPRLLKIGFLTGAALGLGLALILTQLLTLGLFAVGLAGGGIGGYALRGWFYRRNVHDSGATISVGAATPARMKPPVRRSKVLALRSAKVNAA